MNLFGTDGIRTKYGEFPLDSKNLINLAKAICTWTKDKIEFPKIVIASDTRLSSPLIKSLLTSGFLQYEVEIYDACILPTPAIYNLVQKQKLFDFGIVITASHNLFQDNGIKIIYKDKDKLSINDELEISNIFMNKTFATIDNTKLGKLLYYQDSQKNYLDHLSKFFAKKKLNKDLKIIIDCANGATSNFAEQIFSFFDLKPIFIENQPNGKNINQDCGSTKLAKIQKEVMRQKADIGFAFDGDGDRLIAINKNGEIKDGDDILAFLLNHPSYQSQKVVGTIMSNCGFELFLNEQKKELIRTLVGDKHVSYELANQNLLLGGEQSGHIILRDYLNSGDAIFVALRILETIELTQNYEFKTFKKFPHFSLNLNVIQKYDLSTEPFNTIICKYQKEIQGKLIIRYSGTEPVLRITIESSSLEYSKKMANGLLNDLNLVFKNKDLYEKKTQSITSTF